MDVIGVLPGDDGTLWFEAGKFTALLPCFFALASCACLPIVARSFISLNNIYELLNDVCMEECTREQKIPQKKKLWQEPPRCCGPQEVYPRRFLLRIKCPEVFFFGID